MDEGFFKKAMSRVPCGSCGKLYEPDGINVLGHEERTWFLRLVCAGCKGTGLVAAVVKDDAEAPESVTDLSQEELSRLRKAPVSSDDVQGIQEALKDFRGDISRLFSKE